jgi:hypothetical protein
MPVVGLVSSAEFIPHADRPAIVGATTASAWPRRLAPSARAQFADASTSTSCATPLTIPARRLGRPAPLP